MTRRYAFATRLIHAGEAPEPATGAHGVPLYQNSTFAFRSYDQVRGFEGGQVPHFYYQRFANPTVRCLTLKMADLEGAEAAAAGANGMAVITAALLEALAPGGHLVAGADLYPGTSQVLANDLAPVGACATSVDITDLDAVAAAMTPQTRAIYAETLSNPHLQVANLPALAEIAHRQGALLIVDNTFLSPALFRPLEHGADLVLHSATKYLSGTGQVLGGVAAGPRDWIARIDDRLTRTGATMSPFAAWMLLSGIKTLDLRMARHSTTAARLAAMLSAHPAVEQVYFPSVPGHPGAGIATELIGDRYGGLLSFRLRGGEPAVRACLDAMRLATIAVSLGEATTLAWPWGDGLIRLAVGLEDPDDLVADLQAGLDAAAPPMGDA